MVKTLHTCDYNGHVNKVIAHSDSITLEYCYKGSLVTDAFEYTREEAIAAAKAILKHYDIDFNAYEDNISERYRTLTKAEMDQHLKDNPNLVPVINDPDAPLTSELAERFKEELK